MAIIALIVTPLVMSIIRKARIASDKRSIDAYGRSIELAIAGYLLDTGRFPTQISDLTIEYSGNEVVCSTTQLNSDSSVYLAGCTVNGRSVDYSYGSEEVVNYDYRVGAEVTYNGVDYYVIEDSATSESTVKLLKAEPLDVAEVNLYGGVGTANNHVNMYINPEFVNSETANDINGYGGMVFYSSSTCGFIQNSQSWVETDCTNAYANSEIKYVVDAWKNAEAPAATEARLMTYDEYAVNTEIQQVCTGNCFDASVPKYDWMYNNNYSYWLITPAFDSTDNIWAVGYDGGLTGKDVNGHHMDGEETVVRPVIVLSKSLL